MPETDALSNGTRTRNSAAPVGRLEGPVGQRKLTLDRSHSPLQSIYDLSKRGAIQAALREVVRLVDGCLRAGDFDGCNSLFRKIDLDQLDPETATSFLAYTRIAAPDRLIDREPYARAVRAWMASRAVPPAEIDDLLRGLE